MEITIKNINTIEDFEKVHELEIKIWGVDPVPTHQTMTAVKNGGIMLGAFEGEKLVGFQYSFAGFKDGEAYVCSHTLGVDPHYRNRGIGFILKQRQAEEALKLGYKKIRWTYDPLESRNGYLNIAKLGAICGDYIENCYGEMKDTLNNGMPSDRFHVEWYPDHPYLKERHEHFANLEVETSSLALQWKENETGLPCAVPVTNLDLSQASYLFVPIPVDFQKLKEVDHALALDWRLKTRNIFVSLFSKDWAVAHVIRKQNELCQHYVLCRRSELGLSL
jgi:predicted GNAT superfamily acetyltransferase